MVAHTVCYALAGVEGVRVTAEAFVEYDEENSLYTLVGLPDAAVRESRERIAAAMQNSGYRFPQGRVTVSLSPADVRKEGAVFDLPIACALLIATKQIRSVDEDPFLLGELALDGRLLPVRGALSRVIAAYEGGIVSCVLPDGNADEAAAVGGMRVYAAKTLREAAEHLSGRSRLSPRAAGAFRPQAQGYVPAVDLKSVRGQAGARRALEIAAAGGHNLLMIGPPGSGKTMLARCLPGILPPMSMDESLETTRIHSVAGVLPPNVGLMTERPFRAPHHTASAPSLIGGGADARPGEVSLAHNGVLFLDELPEYPRAVLEALRQPLEDGIVSVTRAKAHYTYKAGCMLVASMNPCPCGYFGSRARQCRCGQTQIRKYLDRLSGPLLDRIDMTVEADAVPLDEIERAPDGEDSETVRARVVAAREIQQNRLRGGETRCNARMSSQDAEKYCALNDAARAFLSKAADKYGLSMRGVTRVLKVARTVSDLRGEAEISLPAVAEAVQYRMIDRKYWG